MAIQTLYTGGSEFAMGGIEELNYERSVFINLAYDRSSQASLVAYVAGITALGLIPVLATGRESRGRRLDEIRRSLRGCAHSVHDIQHVGVTRWNMILELGMAIESGKDGNWFVLDSNYRRAIDALSDLNGTDIHTHGGTPFGILAALLNIFAHRSQNVTATDLEEFYKELLKRSLRIRRLERATSLFERRVFLRLVKEATLMARDSPALQATSHSKHTKR